MHREPVGRACGKGDGRRVQDGGLARPRAETAMEKSLGLQGWHARGDYLDEGPVFVC